MIFAVVAGAATKVGLSPASTNNFLLVIGGSGAQGFEPTGKMGKNGMPTYDVPTKHAYANDVANALASTMPMNIHNIACPGENAQTMAGVLPDKCYKDGATQLSKAVEFLKANQDAHGLVTFEIGSNNIRPCIQFKTVDESCWAEEYGYVKQYLPGELAALKTAAGPYVKFVGLLYADPFFKYYISAGIGPADAYLTRTLTNQLNATMASDFRAAGFLIANTPPLFHLNDNTMVTYNGLRVPAGVATICKATWMCSVAPYGPDDHPNTAGYQLQADAILAVLPKSW